VLKVTDKNFESEISLQQNLNFQFNKNLCPDSLLHSWDSTIYLDIQPKVEGSYRWINSNELVFSPNQGFAPNTKYSIKLLPDLLKNSKEKISISDENISFQTPSLLVLQSNTQWSRSNTDNNV